MEENELLQQTNEETIVMIKPQIEAVKPVEENKEMKQKKRIRLNFVGIIGVIVLIVILFFAYKVYQNFNDKGGAPVVGNRFKNGLNPKIEKTNLDAIKEKLKLDGVKAVEVNLTSATLRVNLDVEDIYGLDEIKAISENAKKQIAEILPFDKYFTNREGVKMYDFELHVFNIVKAEEGKTQVYYMLGKTGSGEEYSELLSSPKNQKTSDEVTKKPE